MKQISVSKCSSVLLVAIGVTVGGVVEARDLAGAQRISGLLGALSSASAYAAKHLCSSVLVSGRRRQSVEDGELSISLGVLGITLGDLLAWYDTEIDRAAGRVSAWPKLDPFGWFAARATYRTGLGCTLDLPPDLPLVPVAEPEITLDPHEDTAIDRTVAAIDYQKLDQAFAWAFDPGRDWRTRGMVVLYDGRLVGEHYAEGFSAATPQLGWSMAKSLTNSLIGIAIRDGVIAGVDTDRLLPDWCSQAGDRRCSITLDQLLRMTSGLAFNEDYGDPSADLLIMLLKRGDMGAYAADHGLETPPGTRHVYASGTSNIITLVLKNRIAGTRPTDLAVALAFAQDRLFGPLGIGSAVFEPDAAGTLVGSSYVYATPRDWAKFGLLYARDGVWAGVPWDGVADPATPVRLLPEGWVAYSLTPTTTPDPDDRSEEYGAHIYVEMYQGLLDPDPGSVTPPVPDDDFHFFGHHGQVVSVIPSKKLVVARLGLTAPGPGENDPKDTWNHQRFLSNIVAAVRD